MLFSAMWTTCNNHFDITSFFTLITATPLGDVLISQSQPLAKIFDISVSLSSSFNRNSLSLTCIPPKNIYGIMLSKSASILHFYIHNHQQIHFHQSSRHFSFLLAVLVSLFRSKSVFRLLNLIFGNPQFYFRFQSQSFPLSYPSDKR